MGHPVSTPTRFQTDPLTVGVNGQTAFVSSRPRRPGGLSFLFVGGTQYVEETDYTFTGQNVTWLDVDFTLETTDTVTLKYRA